MGAIGNDAKLFYAREVNRFGTTATIERQLAISYSESTSDAEPEGTEINVRGSFKNPNRGSKDGRKDGASFGSTDVLLNARIFVIPMLDTSLEEFSFIPAIGDKVTIHSVEYSIRKVDPYFTNDVQTQMGLYLEQS